MIPKPLSDVIPDDMLISEDLKLTCEACPVQLEGNYRGHRVYFRLRHGRWRLQVDGQVIAGGSASDNHHLLGNDWDGYVDEDIARAVIDKEIDRYDSGQG